MKAKASAAIAVTIAIAALLAPTAAAAGQTGRAGSKHNPTVTEAFQVPGSNGYSVSVSVRNRSALTVSAVTLHRPSIVAADYKLRLRRSQGSDGIRASLGKLGRIEMRFVPESTRKEEPLFPVCKGERETIAEGHYVGLFEFHGEHGYTRTRVKRAPGWVAVTPAPTCHHRSAGHGPQKRGPRTQENLTRQALAAMAGAAPAAEAEVHGLELKVKTRNPAVKFEASRLSVRKKNGKGFAFDTFLALASRDRGRIREESAVLDLLVEGPYFKVPDLTHLTSEVMVSPPAPYLGTATLRRESSSEVSWTGDLRLNLPGFGVVPLAGPGTHATLCADSGCKQTK